MTELHQVERALFEGKVNGLVLTCFENERPLRGVLGWMDWQFYGVFSKWLKEGKLTGQAGECVYVAAQKGGKTFHFIVAGGGSLNDEQKRGELPQPTLNNLKKNILGLKFNSVGIAQSEASKTLEKWAAQELKGKLVWIKQ